MLSKLSLERALLGLDFGFSPLPDSENIISQKEKLRANEKRKLIASICVCIVVAVVIFEEQSPLSQSFKILVPQIYLKLGISIFYSGK